MPGRAPGNPYVRSTITQDFPRRTPRKKLPKLNREILDTWETPYQIARRQKSARPDCLAPGPGKKSPGRAPTARHNSAAICDVFRAHNNKVPPETCTATIIDTKLAASFEFFHARPGPDIEREEREGPGRFAHRPPRGAGPDGAKISIRND